ncbi:hypothetical protein ACQKM2_09205 [Streptomyces sp. NPDC004126]|uniref:hypothetical protein n=1 Tax=Streptomyces sp. NPDC004126 TaxID=3390695 RepID=UPI003CFF1FE8
MLKKILGKLAVPPIDVAAGEAWTRGDTVFIRKQFAAPEKLDTDVARAIQVVTAIGWHSASVTFEGEGLQRAANLVFTRPAA